MSYLQDHLARFDRVAWSCDRKVRYRSWNDADRIRRRMRRKGASSHDTHLDVYRCRYCQGFHIGSS